MSAQTPDSDSHPDSPGQGPDPGSIADPLLALLQRDSTTVVSVTYRTIRAQCQGPGCSVTIEQPDRPGRKRIYHSAACRQAAYRARRAQQSEDYQSWLRRLNQTE